MIKKEFHSIYNHIEFFFKGFYLDKKINTYNFKYQNTQVFEIAQLLA